MRILDLFCGLGGASTGYARAGFEVVGVDICPQPDYPFKFIQADVLDFLQPPCFWDLEGFDAIHASPPCAAYTNIGKQNAALGKGLKHPRLCEPVRTALDAIGLPYVIENPAARADVTLCGEMFGLGVLRHRKFECGGWQCPQPEHVPHRGLVRGWRHGVCKDGPYVAAYGNGGDKATLAEVQKAMDIPWATDRMQAFQAIPPAYTHYLGLHLAGAL